MLAFCHYNTGDNQLIKGKVYFGSQFWRFQFMVACCFGPVAKQEMTVGTCGGAKPLTSWLESKREKGEG